MIKYSDITKSVGDQAVDAAKLVQERVVEGLESFDGVAEKVASMFPSMPELPKLPFAESLPSLADIVEANVALVERMVKANKELVLAVAHAVPTFERTAAA